MHVGFPLKERHHPPGRELPGGMTEYKSELKSGAAPTG
jgi:hypothetical protein